MSDLKILSLRDIGEISTGINSPEDKFDYGNKKQFVTHTDCQKLQAENKALKDLVESVYRVVNAVKVSKDSDAIKVRVIENLIKNHKEQA